MSALTSKRLMTDLAMLIVFALGGWFLFVTFIKGGATDAGTKRLHGDGDSDGGGWARVKGADGKTYTQWRGKPGMETEPGIVAGEGVHGEVVEIATNGVAGYTTYELLLQLNDVGKAAKTAPLNCYTIYGTADRPLEMPPAFQTDLPFGAHIGGTSPQFWVGDGRSATERPACLFASLSVLPPVRCRVPQAVKAEAEFDSWLTVSVTEGNTHDDLSAIGIDFESWSVLPCALTRYCLGGMVAAQRESERETMTGRDRKRVVSKAAPPHISRAVTCRCQVVKGAAVRRQRRCVLD